MARRFQEGHGFDDVTPALASFLWQAGDISYKFDSLQTHIHDTVVANYSRAKQICVLSSRQIGKSYWALGFALMYLLTNPRTLVRLIAPTKDKADELIEDNLLPLMLDCPEGLIHKVKAKRRWNVSNGSSLRIGALERQYVDSNRGGNAKLIIYEECGFVNGDDFNYGRKSVMGAQLLRSNGHEIFVSSPSEDPNHPLHNEIMPDCDPMGTLFRYTVWDSPSLTREQVDQAAQRSGGYDSDDFKREYLAMVIRSKTLMVIPTVHENKCFGDWPVPPDMRDRIMVTGDWGGVRDKTVFLAHWYLPEADMSFVIDELVYPANTTTNVIAKDLRAWIKKYQLSHLWADMPGQLRVDLSALFPWVHVASPPKHDWMAGVNSMAARFAMDKMRIDKRCGFLKQSVLGGMFNKNRTDFERSASLGHMDALAALSYSLRVQKLEIGLKDAYSNERIVSPEVKEKLTTPAFGGFKVDQSNDRAPIRNFQISGNSSWAAAKRRS